MKIACCSTLNDLYFKGFLTFFYSLIHNNPSFNYPYYIFTWGDLSVDNINTLKNIYSNFVFKNIDNSKYVNARYSTTFRNWNINCINRFEIFTLTEYDKLVFFDADMLVMGDVSYLFDVDVEFGACEIEKGSELDHPSKYDTSLKSFDGGLMVISKKYLNIETQKTLIDIALQKKWTSDEPILNVYFDNTRTTFLPKEYNLLISEVTQENINTTKIIQFVGVEKPWFEGSLTNRYPDFAFKKINNLKLLLSVDLQFKRYYNNAIKYAEQKNSSNCTAR